MAYKPTVGLIADAFSSGFRQRQQQDQQQAQFDLELYQKERQQGLLNFWKQKDFQAEQSYRKSVLDNQKEDNARQRDYLDMQQKNIDLDNKLQRDKFEWDKKQDGIRNSIDRQKTTSEPQFKGFVKYFQERPQYLGTTTPIKDPKNNGKYIDSPLTQNEIQSNRNYLQSIALSELPQRAQTLYVNKFMGKKIHPYEFYTGVEDAYKNGLINDLDYNALLQFNDLRQDWGEFPDAIPNTPEMPKSKKTDKGLLGIVGDTAKKIGQSRINKITDKYNNAPTWTKNNPIAKGLYAGWDYLGILDSEGGILNDIKKKLKRNNYAK